MIKCKLNYLGSKFKLLDFINRAINDFVTIDGAQCADIFAGTAIVSQFFAFNNAQKVISNDLEYYSHIIAKNYLGNVEKIEYKDRLNELNELKGEKGFIYNNYCSAGNRLYFSDKNGKKIDAVRLKIQEWFDKNEIEENEYVFYLCSLLESADKIANVASVYGAYLKKLKKTALKELVIEPSIPFFWQDFIYDSKQYSCECYQKDANELIKNISGDILYLDPPYNSRQYGANYHILNTIAEYKNFNPKGVTGLPQYNKSDYCYKDEVSKSLSELISDADFEWIFLSYNNQGILSFKDIKEIFNSYGEYNYRYTHYKAYKADNKRDYKDDKTCEYIHILKKK